MRIVKLDNLPTTYDGSKIDWRKSIGKTVEFIYDDIVGFIDIIDYKDAYLYIKYLDYPIFKIYHGSFKKCCLGKMLNKFTNQFKIDLNYKINDEKRSLVIIDREKRGGYKYYKYVCNKCSYSNWLEESSLIKGVGCTCCAGKVVIKGINDIATTRPDLLLYFNNIEDAYINTYGSTKKVICKCPECGNTKPISLQKLSYYGFSCDKCSDGISYPEKFINSMLSQITPEYIYQLSKKYYKWCQNYKYDFVINSKSIIIETHGLNHYTIYNFSSLGGKTLEEEQENDRIKEQLAKQNGIKHYIVLDCRKSELEWIKESVMESKLPTLLNFKEDEILIG